jgi:hypothetical protein
VVVGRRRRRSWSIGGGMLWCQCIVPVTCKRVVSKIKKEKKKKEKQTKKERKRGMGG